MPTSLSCHCLLNCSVQASSLLLEPLPSILSGIRFALWYDISHKALDYFASLLVNLLHVPIHGFPMLPILATLLPLLVTSSSVISDSIGFFILLLYLYFVWFLTEKVPHWMLFWELTKINSCTNFRASPRFPPCYITGASQQINKTPLWE